MRKIKLRGNGKISTFGLMIFLASAFVSSVSAQANDWSIADYFKNLPEKYITASGDFARRSKETAVIDEPNGYAAYLSAPPSQTDSSNLPFPIFEMAVFKSQTKPPLIVVANRISDSACTEYETFFLRRVGNKWAEVKSQVLPTMNLKMFWDAPQSANRVLKIIKESSISYHFEPPRQGTRMKVSLEICDYLADDAPDADGEELRKLSESAKPIYLDWNSKNGKFNFAK